LIAQGRWDSCLAVADEGDDATLRIRYRAFLANVLASTGALDRARATLAEAMEGASEYTAPSARVLLYWSLARVAWLDSDAETAIAYISRAIALLEASEDSLQLARAHLLSAQFHTIDQRFLDAIPHVEQAERLLTLAGDRDDFALLRAEQAKIAAATGEPESALALAREAVELIEGDDRHAPTAAHALGVAEAACGNLDAAEEAFARAVDALSEQRDFRQAAYAARDWATALRAAGRESDAYEVMERSMLLTVRERGAAARQATRQKS
jgi:tetratricopeptide (TPR) repeat protein